MSSISTRHKKFADEYLSNGLNATRAYLAVYDGTYDVDTKRYNAASSSAAKLLKDDRIKAYIEESSRQDALSAGEVLSLYKRRATFDMSDYITGYGSNLMIDINKLKADGFGDMITGFQYNNRGIGYVTLVNKEHALDQIAKALGLGKEANDSTVTLKIVSQEDFDLL